MAKKPIKKENRISNVPRKDANKKSKSVLIYKEGLTLQEVAASLEKTPVEIIKSLMKLGYMMTQNQIMTKDICELLCLELGIEIKDEVVTDIERFDEFDIVDDEKDLVKRPPVVTIMGHVDHGKTTLLDHIRHSRVVTQEAGGITQHIGAYQIKRNNNLITFIDTPGHAAFSEMRARGAKVTDITVLVVAADDGVMPQTEEAIAHAKAAKVPIIVAINKMDKPSANPERVMQELSRFDLLPEAWGGDTIYCEISALSGKGVDNLLDMIELLAEVEDYKANPNRLAIGSVIEAKMDKGRGPVATLIIQNGTLKVHDNIVIGTTYGKIRTMQDDTGRKYETALPSQAVEVTGLNEVPKAGDKFMVLLDEKQAKQTAEARFHKEWVKERGTNKIASLEDMFKEIKDGEFKELNLIVKADTQGSAEAIRGSLEKLGMEDVKVNIIRCSVGAITDTDVTLATVSNAIIMGFNIRPNGTVREIAKDKGVEIRFYNIIYTMIDDIKQAVKGMLEPIYEEIVTGMCDVRNLFKISKVGTVAGCYVTNGYIERNSLVRILRNGVVVYEGKMASLKRFKDDVKEVKQGYECGIMIENFNDIKENDIIEASVMKEVERK